MAKVIGPLFSQEARGQIGKSIVFTRRRGQNVARGYVIPANPNTTGQFRSRVTFGVVGSVNRRIRATNWRLPSETQTIIEWASGLLRTGEVWPSALARLSIGAGAVFYDASLILWDNTEAGIQDEWNEQAGNAPTGLEDYRSGEVRVQRGYLLFQNTRMLAANGYGPAFDSEEVPLYVSG